MQQKLRNILTAVMSAGFAAVLLLPTGAKALTISPPTIDHQLNPGDTVLEVIKVFNEDDKPITVFPLVENFTAGTEEKGQPQFYPAEEDKDGTALAKWITVDTQPLTIQPMERTNLQLAINVPKDAQPGGHYGAVLLSTTPPEERTGVGVASQLATLILIRVSGDVKEIGSLAEFGYAHPQVWYNYRPVDFFIRFENSGNTHLRPVGNLFIKDMFGRQVASIPVNTPDYQSVLPNSIRRFDFGWQGGPVAASDGELAKEWQGFGFGKYKATLVLNYGNEQKLIVDEREFSIWPWRILTIAGAGLLVLILLILVLGRLYNKSIIAKYKKMMDKEKKKPAEAKEEEKK